MGGVPLTLKDGKLSVTDSFETSVKGVFAGGDCTGIGEDLTVTAVQHGKLAAIAINKSLMGNSGPGGKRG